MKRNLFFREIKLLIILEKAPCLPHKFQCLNKGHHQCCLTTHRAAQLIALQRILNTAAPQRQCCGVKNIIPIAEKSNSKAGKVSSHPKMALGIEMNPVLQLSFGQSRNSDRFITTLSSDFMVFLKNTYILLKSIYLGRI